MRPLLPEESVRHRPEGSRSVFIGTSDRTRFSNSTLNTVGNWLPRGWVWRRSVLGPLQTLQTVIRMVALGSKGSRAALRDDVADMHRVFGWDGGAPTLTAAVELPDGVAGSIVWGGASAPLRPGRQRLELGR